MKRQGYIFPARIFLERYNLLYFSFLILLSLIILLISTSISRADVTFKAKCNKDAGQVLDQPITFKFLKLSSGKWKASHFNRDETNFNIIGNNEIFMWWVASLERGDLMGLTLSFKDKGIMYSYIKMNKEEINELKEKHAKFKDNEISARDFDLVKRDIINRNEDTERMHTAFLEDCSGTIFRWVGF